MVTHGRRNQQFFIERYNYELTLGSEQVDLFMANGFSDFVVNRPSSSGAKCNCFRQMRRAPVTCSLSMAGVDYARSEACAATEGL
jgi:hypothetical protein